MKRMKKLNMLSAILMAGGIVTGSWQVNAQSTGGEGTISNDDGGMANDGSSLSNSKNVIVEANRIVAYEAPATASNRALSPFDPSQARSRLPLTTPEIMPFENTTGRTEPTDKPGSSADPTFGKEAYGTQSILWPYTTARVAAASTAASKVADHVPVTAVPYRQTGKLYVRFGSSWFVCTASLIKKGVLITAAHCVHNYGNQAAGFADEIRWFPANIYSTGGPWGYFQGVTWRIPLPYYNGTDTCQTGADGIVCDNDIATVTLAPKSGQYAGQILGGWYGYGWNLYSFVWNAAMFGGATVASIHQLGYPVAIDNGYKMERTTSVGKYVTTTSTTTGQLLRNIQLGSAQTGGSSGGPWLVNFGTRPTITGAADLGNQSASNIVMAVTSWGYTATGTNVQGASYFGQNAEYPGTYGAYGSGNIGALMQGTCTGSPAHC